jgi:hypothetical protein
MIDKPLEQITYADIDAFVQEGWPEGKTVEYKRENYGARDENKKELLKDVSSFANTLGGDIVIGVEEANGVPTGIPGIALADADSEKLRLEGIIRQGLEPRIDFEIHHVVTPLSTTVLVIRIKESLLLPHRVVFRGTFGEFWARSSAGKFSMDTDELRRAFTLSDSVYEQIRSFRQNRVLQILREDTPVPLLAGAKLILHLVPVSSVRSRQRFDVAMMPDLATQFPPIASSGWNHRLNLDGHVNYAGQDEAGQFYSYTQFFRNGIVEAALADVVREGEANGKLLLAGYYESRLTQQFRTMERFTQGLSELGVEPPVWLMMSLVGVKGATIPTSGYFRGERREIDRDVLMLPETIIDDLSQSAFQILHLSFDLVWNASGYARSFNFDDEGNWVGR